LSLIKVKKLKNDENKILTNNYRFFQKKVD